MNTSEVLMHLEEIHAILVNEMPESAAATLKTFQQALSEAQRSVGACRFCHGRGVVFYTSSAHGSGHLTLKMKGSEGVIYQYKCTKCDGAGKRVDVKCLSCLTGFSPPVLPRFRQIEMLYPEDLCEKCFASVENKIGVIFPEKAAEETKKLEPKKNDNPAPAKKGGKR